MKLSDKKRIALVLSGGGVKAAAFHIGVCLALREKGFSFAGGQRTEDRLTFEGKALTVTLYVGSSAGSVIATLLAAGHSIDAIIDAFTKGHGFNSLVRPGPKDSTLKPLTYRDIFKINFGTAKPTRLIPLLFRKRLNVSGGMESIFKEAFSINGLFSTKNLERYVREHVCPENDFSRLSAELYVVATQLNHSRKAVFGPFAESSKNKEVKRINYARISEAVAASAALPPFFAPFGIKNQKGKEIHYFDGEIRDTLSTHIASEAGADLVIASYSIQPYHYTPEMGSLYDYGMPAIFNQALYQVVQKKIESHIKHQQDVRGIINAVQGYMRGQGLAEEHVQKLLEILISRTNFNPLVDYIYIHPSPQDFEFFFYDHFSLNERVLDGIVRTGFKAAMTTLRGYNL